MIKTITNIDYLEDVALVTVNNIPNSSKNVSFILNEIAARDVTVDMICQTAPYKDKISLSFTVPQDSLAEVIAATTAFRNLNRRKRKQYKNYSFRRGNAQHLGRCGRTF